MNIYIICSVRDADEKLRAELEAYTNWLEDKGHFVHLPHRDTNQDASGLDICLENAAAIRLCDEVHVFYDPSSQGSHFDLGMLFMLDQIEGVKKRVRLIKSPKIEPGKSFPRMINEWMHLQNEYSSLYSESYHATELDFALPFENF